MNRYTIGCAVLGAHGGRKRGRSVIGRFIPGIIHGDDGGKVPTVAWVGLGLGIAGLAAAAIYNTAKG